MKIFAKFAPEIRDGSDRHPRLSKKDKMKQLLFVCCAVMLVSCAQGHKSDLQRKVADYETVKISAPDLSAISDNGKEVLNLYRWAADEADAIYWKQVFGDKSLMLALPDAAARDYALINYGPWDRLDGTTFVDGYGNRPLGAGFYPTDMTAAEFEKLPEADRNNPYTIVTRAGDGSLKTVPFHEAYAEHIEKISSYLSSAANLTIKPSVREYLLKKIEALRSDDYEAADKAWLSMDDSKMDLIIGPNENEDDQLYGIRRSYGAFVLLKQVELTARIDQLTAMLPELQASLPCEPAYKTFVPGSRSEIYAYDALYYAGNYNAGVKVIAVNLPYDEKVQAEMGTRTALMHNIMNEKFNRIVFPTGRLLLTSAETEQLNAKAFFWNIVFREVAHGLGVKETVNGKGSVAQALGNEALMMEEMKGNVVGLFLACKLADSHQLNGLVTKKEAIATFCASLFRSERFGNATALGRANIAILNYLLEKNVLTRAENGKYSINYEGLEQAIRELASQVLTIQATGDREAAAAFEQQYAALGKNYKEDLRNIRLEGIPADLRFDFAK